MAPDERKVDRLFGIDGSPMRRNKGVSLGSMAQRRYFCGLSQGGTVLARRRNVRQIAVKHRGMGGVRGDPSKKPLHRSENAELGARKQGGRSRFFDTAHGFLLFVSGATAQFMPCERNAITPSYYA